MKQFLTLYYKGKDGNMRQWRCWADGPAVFVEHGCVGGTLQSSVGAECQETNVGRSNYRSEVEQAEVEAEALHTYKLERRYRLTQDEANLDLFLPMLAHSIEDRALVYPVDVQPKFDGVRCMAYWCGDELALMSRSGKPYSVPHIERELRLLLPKDKVFDGELYAHGKSCQQITSLVKRYREESLALIYCVYDVPSAKSVWRSRLQELYSFEDSQNVKFVATLECSDFESVKACERSFIEQGFEGAIVRLRDGLYEFGRRSNALLKVKTFQDEEFEVIEVNEGKGKFQDAAIFTCKNNIPTPGAEKDTFEVVAPGDMEAKFHFLNTHTFWIGKKLTVKFFGRTDAPELLPRFPVGKCFRDEKDLAK